MNRWTVRRWRIGGRLVGGRWSMEDRTVTTGYRLPITDTPGNPALAGRKAGAVRRVVGRANRKGSACCTLRAQNPSLSPRAEPPWGQAVNRYRGRMRNPISRRRAAVHGLTGCPRSLAGSPERRSKPMGVSSRSAAAAAATSSTDPPVNPSLAGRRAGAVRRVVGRGRGDAPQLHRTAESGIEPRTAGPIRGRWHRAAEGGIGRGKATSNRGRRHRAEEGGACPP
jgi:hypothetical protein